MTPDDKDEAAGAAPPDDNEIRPIVVHGPVQGTDGRTVDPAPPAAPEVQPGVEPDYLVENPVESSRKDVPALPLAVTRAIPAGPALPAPSIAAFAAPTESAYFARAAAVTLAALAPPPPPPPVETPLEVAPRLEPREAKVAPPREKKSRLRPKPATAQTGAPSDERRALGLDALRGLFLIVMTLGFTIYGETFPPWMYHRQMPPPTYEVVDIAGIGWRDIAYGAFLFTMAAALPVTLSRRIAKGEVEAAIVLAAIKRYFMLFVFGLLVAHSNLAVIGYGKKFRGVALVGFVVMALIYTRRRKDWDPTEYKIVNRFGWLAAVLFLALSPLVYDSTFSFARNDDIIRGLAFASLTGSIVWYFTRESLGWRMVVLGFVLALYLGSKGDSWLSTFWWTTPAEWLMKPADLTLLAIVIPGTIAGDMLIRWMAEPATPAGERTFSWSRLRVSTLGLLCALFAPLIVYGLYNRWVLATTQIVLALIVAGFFLTLQPVTSSDKLLRQLFMWGAMWLLVGVLLEPFEGGIKKVPDTLSYLFTVTGITTMLLVTLSAVASRPRPPAILRPLLDVGTNPLLAYVLYTVFLNSALEMIAPLRPFMRNTLELSFLRSVLSTILVVLIVQALTRKRIFWRT